ncbi:unnamed protein product [Lactuca virosa]|uniref:Uncharacterized protein n=1 Tax=Lactuca virosa TaxID=75947 RepID=A0AAU9NEM8_9ASTR|nr:unnamed protein product [Lactuca virosa]
MTIVKPFVHVFFLFLICTTDNVCSRRLVSEEKTSVVIPNLLNTVRQLLILLSNVITNVDNVEDVGNMGLISTFQFLEKILQRLQGILQGLNVRDIVTPTGGFMGDTRERTNFELNNGGGGGAGVGAIPGGGI